MSKIFFLLCTVNIFDIGSGLQNVHNWLSSIFIARYIPNVIVHPRIQAHHDVLFEILLNINPFIFDQLEVKAKSK